MPSIFQFVPSSPRYLISKGKKIEALRVLNIVAQFNCKPPLRVKLLTDQEKEDLVAATGSDLEERTGERAEEHGSTELDHLVEEPQQQMVERPMGGEDAPNERLDGQSSVECARQVGGQEMVKDGTLSLPEAERAGDDGQTSAGSVSPLIVSLKSPERSSKSRSVVARLVSLFSTFIMHT